MFIGIESDNNDKRYIALDVVAEIKVDEIITVKTKRGEVYTVHGDFRKFVNSLLMLGDDK